MKVKNLFCIVAIMTFSIVASAKDAEVLPIESQIESSISHKINGYKYLCMEDQGNQYDLEDKFNAFFESIGFTILTPDDEEYLDDEERLYVLYGSYEHKAVPDALNNTTLTLRDKDGKIVFSSTKESACFVSVKSCANKGSDKIIKQIKELNYTFDPNLVRKSHKNKRITQEDPQIDTADSTNVVTHTELSTSEKKVGSNNGGHKINGYKYLCMEQQGNKYDLEDKFNAFFASIGFVILTPDDEEELDDTERIHVLYGTYEHNAVPDALNNTTLTLRNKDGIIIFSSTKESACFVSVKSCANKGSDKIIKQIKELNYKYNPDLVVKNSKNKSIKNQTPIKNTETSLEDDCDCPDKE